MISDEDLRQWRMWVDGDPQKVTEISCEAMPQLLDENADLKTRLAELKENYEFQRRCWAEVHGAMKCPGDRNLAEWAKAQTDRVAALEVEELDNLGTLTHVARRLGVERSEHSLRNIIGLLEARVAELEREAEATESFISKHVPAHLRLAREIDLAGLTLRFEEPKPDQSGEGEG